MPRFSEAARKANLALVELLGTIAARKRATRAQIALAGTTKVHRLEENVGAANVALDAADLAEIGAALSRIKVEGDRYPAALQANIAVEGGSTVPLQHCPIWTPVGNGQSALARGQAMPITEDERDEHESLLDLYLANRQ